VKNKIVNKSNKYHTTLIINIFVYFVLDVIYNPVNKVIKTCEQIVLHVFYNTYYYYYKIIMDLMNNRVSNE